MEGKWNVRANLNDSTASIRVWKNDTPVEGHLFEQITLSPLGMQVTGSYEGKECYAGDMSIEVETTQGIIKLEGGSGGIEPEKQTFDYSWDTKKPFDVSKATAIIINGTRIPIR